VSASKRIAVAGATGRAGSAVVELLRADGHDVVPMARSVGVDVITGAGLDAALEGVDAIVDVATGPSPDEREATEFFTTSGRNLQEAGARAGVGRIVAASIVGCDRFSGGYNAGKVAHERVLLEGPLPVRILRATQFHEFVATMMDWGRRDGVVAVPRFQTQLIAVRSVAEELAALALADDPEGGKITEIAGPRPESLAAVAALRVAHCGEDVRVAEYSNPDDPDSVLYADGGALPGPGATLAGPTFAEWLAA
jgi:uncharacterized protein YbjT (DUF2867 family)